MRIAVGIFLLPWLALWAAPPVPYSGKVAINGINYHGSANFSFSLKDANGTTHWQNGVDANESIRISVVNGRYSVMLGGQGMNPLPPELFLQHDDLYLSVSFDKGDGPRSLGPDQLITATPRALVAEVAKVAEMAKVAKVAEKLSGEITSDMLSPEVLSKLDANQSAAPMVPITRDMLPADVLADLNKSAPAITSITRDMLPADVLADLNKTAPAFGPITLSMLAPEVTAKLESNASGGISGSITRDMLPSDVLADLNKTTSITRDMLPADVLADLNKSAPSIGPITLSMLDAEVTAKLDTNTSGSTTVNNPPAVGSLIAIPYGESAPAGYSLYQRGTPKELVWEEKAPVSVARSGKSVILDGQIYFVGGRSSIGVYHREAERYDPLANAWETLPSMASKRMSLALCKFGTKIYAVGGKNNGTDPGLKSTEIYDPASNQWSGGINLPNPVYSANALNFANSIFLFCGRNDNIANISVNSVFHLSLNDTVWVEKTPRSSGGSTKVFIHENRIWTSNLNTIEIYEPGSDIWTFGPPDLNKSNGVLLSVNNQVLSFGGTDYNSRTDKIKKFDFTENIWLEIGSLPEPMNGMAIEILNEQIFVIGGCITLGQNTSASSKVYSISEADLNASVEGVFDLYRKDGNASAGTPFVQAEVADGSVTARKMASNTITTSQLNEQILKYLKPEITGQPKGQVVYADSNVSFSVTAEGKYLSYQWKKYGSNLTGETNSTLSITDSNATLHDGNYSVVVSNDFGSVESGEVLLDVNTTWSTDGLVAWYPFDGNASDMSGNGNHGAVNGAILGEDRYGVAGKAYQFDGVDDFLDMGDKAEFDGRVAQTISLWLSVSTKGSGTGNNMRPVLSKWYSSGSVSRNSFQISADENGIHHGVSSDSVSSSIDATTDYELNEWHHALLKFNGGNLLLYLNGALISNETVNANSLSNATEPLLIGNWYQGYDPAYKTFHGSIDEVRIYDRALSAAEVQALYNMGQ